MINFKKAITHAGKFHADDVFSAALLRMLQPNIAIERVSALPEDTSDCIVFDIGGGEFDHHQNDAPVRENGVKYAAFGLLWREYGHLLCPAQKSVDMIDLSLVQGLDDCDNGGAPDTLAFVIGSFNPTYDSSESFDEAFERVVTTYAIPILSRITERENNAVKGEEEVKAALSRSRDGIVVLERFAPWGNVLVESEALFVIFPSLRGGYNCQAIPKELGSRETKLSFPNEWWGLSGSELAAASGISGLTFCHKNGFLAAAKSLEDAISAAYAALK